MFTPLFGRVHFKTNYNYRLSNHCFINELILVTYALISNAVEKIDFQLPGNLTDESVILDTVQLPLKNHLFLDVPSDDLY